jgi:hypothetical protein
MGLEGCCTGPCSRTSPGSRDGQAQVPRPRRAPDATGALPEAVLGFVGSDGSDRPLRRGSALGLCGDRLEGLTVLVKAEHDPVVDQPGEATGRRVEASGASQTEPLLLVAGLPALSPGAARPAEVGRSTLDEQTLAFGGSAWAVRRQPVGERPRARAGG